LRDHGLGFCVLTKGGSRALADIDLYRPDRDAFAATLTSLDDTVSKKWERNAALPGDRIETLKKFHEHGIFTWVSLEPTLDCDTSIEIVRETHKFVDLFKVGRVNYLPMTKTTDWEDYTHRMIAVMKELGAAHYIKKDLQQYLPPNYPKPLRVPQRHESAVNDGLRKEVNDLHHEVISFVLYKFEPKLKSWYESHHSELDQDARSCLHNGLMVAADSLMRLAQTVDGRVPSEMTDDQEAAQPTAAAA